MRRRGFVPTALHVIDFQMRAALICDLFASAFIARVHLSLSLSHSRRRRQFSEMQTRNAAGGPRALNCCVHYLSLLSLARSSIVSRAQRDVVFPLGRAANTINGCFFFFTGCISNPFKALTLSARSIFAPTVHLQELSERCFYRDLYSRRSTAEAFCCRADVLLFCN
jgi:hypothetical protein